MLDSRTINHKYMLKQSDRILKYDILLNKGDLDEIPFEGAPNKNSDPADI